MALGGSVLHPHTARSVTPAVLAALAALLGTLLVAVPQAHASAGMRRASAEPDWRLTSRHVPVTHEGGTVREQVTLDLPDRAVVSIEVWGVHRVRGPVQLGSLAAGVHHWTWGGRRDDGSRVADGDYTIEVTASFDGETSEFPHAAEAVVHRHYHPGTLTTEHRTIYPRSTATHDTTLLDNQVRTSRYDDQTLGIRGTIRVRSAGGTTVFSRRFTKFRTHLHVTWDGRTAHGRAVPKGTYTAVVSGTDEDGLTGRVSRTVKVSGARLVLRTRSVTVSPEETSGPTSPPHCNGCGERPDCGTVTPSVRFAAYEGARTVDSGPTCDETTGFWAARSGHFLETHADAPRGYGKARVSMLGGPSTVGGTDHAHLTINPFFDDCSAPGAGPICATNVQTATGDTVRTSTPFVGSGTLFEAGDLDHGISWLVSTTRGDSYDVASFTVTYRFLTPRS